MVHRAFRGASTHALQLSAAAWIALASVVQPAFAQTATLTLNGALRKALAADATLPAAKSRVIGAEAGVRQAGRSLNPVVGVEVENVAGSGAYRGLNRPETTGFVQQVIELGNKREARTGVARSELQTVRARGAVRVLDFLREVELAWVDVLVTTSQLRIAQERLTIATLLRGEITRRTEAGRDPQFTQTRAEAQVSLEQIAVDQAAASARIARTNLASYWRGAPDFDIDLAAFDGVLSRPSGETFNVDVAVLEAERETAAARVGLERVRAIPDPAVRLGVRHFGESRDAAVVVGVSIPIPLFDTNQGNIDRAEAEKKAAEFDAQTGQRVFRRELVRLKARLIASATEARRIEAEVVPQAERAVQLIRSGLERGAFSYIEFVDAQRILNEARLRRIEALKTYHQDNATLARLTGRHAYLDARKPKS